MAASYSEQILEVSTFPPAPMHAVGKKVNGVGVFVGVRVVGQDIGDLLRTPFVICHNLILSG